LTVLKDSSFYLFSEIASKSIAFLMLPYIARKLGSDGFGELSYYQIFISLGIVLLGFTQGGAISRYYYFYGNRGIDNIVFTGIIFSSSLSLLTIFIAYYFNLNWVIYVVLVALSTELINAQLAVRQCKKNSMSYAKISIFNSVLNSGIILCLFELFPKEPIYWLLGTLFGNTVIFIIIARKIFKNNNCFTKPRIFRLNIRYILSFGFPLLFHQLSIFTKGQFDRLLISESFSLNDLGKYTAAFQLASVFSILIMAINKAVVPHYYEYLKRGDLSLSMIKKYSLIVLFFSPLPALVSLCFPDQLYILILGNEFDDISYLVSLFLLGGGVSMPYLFIVNYYFYLGKTSFISFCTFLGSIFYVIYIIYISDFGLEYLPLGITISYLIPYILLMMKKQG
jgi:O-antigen/teichoic acid export membrane protein